MIRWLSCTLHLVTSDNLLQLAILITAVSYENYTNLEQPPLSSLCGARVKILAFARTKLTYSLHTASYLTNCPSKGSTNCFFGDCTCCISQRSSTACTRKVGVAVTRIGSYVYGRFQSLLLLYYLWCHVCIRHMAAVSSIALLEKFESRRQ